MPIVERIMRAFWFIATFLVIQIIIGHFIHKSQSDLPNIRTGIPTHHINTRSIPCVIDTPDWSYFCPSDKIGSINYTNNKHWAGMKIQSDPNLKIEKEYTNYENFTTDYNLIITSDKAGTFPIDIIIADHSEIPLPMALLENNNIKHPTQRNIYTYNSDLPSPTNKLQKDHWLGLNSTYWAHIIQPQQDAEYESIELIRPNYSGCLPGYQIRSNIQLNANEPTILSFKIFSGPKDMSLLQSHQFTKLEYLIDCGWLTFVVRPMYLLVSFLSKFFNDNFSYVILLLVILSRVIFPSHTTDAQDILVLRNILITTIWMIILLILSGVSIETQFSSILWIPNISLPDPTSIIQDIAPGLGLNYISYTTALAMVLSLLQTYFSKPDQILISFIMGLVMDFLPFLVVIVQIMDNAIKLVQIAYSKIKNM